MDQNRDWKPVAALVLAALALFIALGGAQGRGNDQAGAIPQQIIIQPAAPSAGQTGGAVAPQVILPAPPAGATHAWDGWAGGGPGGSHRFFFPLLLFPLLLLAGLALLAFKVAGRRRYGGGPGWYGRPWGPGPGPQGPPQGQPYEHYQQYQQYPQGYGPGQPYGGGYYPQGQQPQQPQQPQQGQPPQASEPNDAHGDITRPQGTGN